MLVLWRAPTDSVPVVDDSRTNAFGSSTGVASGV
jgi:hypothetical protein